MTRSIISKFLIVLIVLFTALSVFWFFKTSTIKKQAMALIAASGGKISAVSVSVSGFPLEQKLIIEDLKFQLAATLPQLPLMPTNNKYQINIKKLEATASIISGDFKVTNIEDVSFQDQNGVVSSVQFNQPPVADFSVVGGELTKLSYQDTGYKILDAGKNVLFENGNSLINFESAIENDKYRNKVKVEFKDVGMFSDIIAAPAVTSQALPDASAQKPAETPSDPAVAQVQPSAPAVADSGAPANQSSNLVKKSFILELEYVVAKSGATPTEVPAPDVGNTAASDVAPSGDDSKLESINIKNFEISSPLYKVNINGEVSSFQKEGFPISSISARIEKFDNVLIYLKKSLSDMVNAKSTIPDGASNVTISGDTAASTAAATASDSATAPAASQKPEVDVVAIIKDLSKKNPATNDEIAVFDFRQEQGKDLLINETSLSEVMAQMFSSVINVSPASSSAPAGAPGAVNPVPAAVAPSAPVAAVVPTSPIVGKPTAPAAVPAPAQIAPKTN
jgi:hypothetical protein